MQQWLDQEEVFLSCLSLRTCRPGPMWEPMVQGPSLPPLYCGMWTTTGWGLGEASCFREDCPGGTQHLGAELSAGLSTTGLCQALPGSPPPPPRPRQPHRVWPYFQTPAPGGLLANDSFFLHPGDDSSSCSHKRESHLPCDLFSWMSQRFLRNIRN